MSQAPHIVATGVTVFDTLFLESITNNEPIIDRMTNKDITIRYYSNKYIVYNGNNPVNFEQYDTFSFIAKNIVGPQSKKIFDYKANTAYTVLAKHSDIIGEISYCFKLSGYQIEKAPIIETSAVFLNGRPVIVKKEVYVLMIEQGNTQTNGGFKIIKVDHSLLAANILSDLN